MFFDYYAFCDGSFRNVEKDGSIAGYSLKTKLTYYRGIPLSMVAALGIEVDGVPVPQESIKLSVDNEDWFTLDEMKTVTSYKWEFGEEADIFVEAPGGLSKGEHDILVRTTITVAYAPINFTGERMRRVIV